ncbi:hypothetical protein H5410_045834 [Solanum commersonii]|uniref:Uncharacterized protein n=1 Tax=Solanum commersonii TaxID=4109 RepID=A0A9J5XET6_SOLCO|nr:hypothetical protein H5410_045834 [Solanum commersonii]
MVGSKSSNNHILHQKDSTHVEFDRSNSVVEYTQFDVFQDEKFVQYEGLHVIDELSAEFGNTLDLDKKDEGESASRWADLVEEENHTPSPSTSSNLSATKINVTDRDILYDLDNDMSDGDDEDEMLDICFDKVVKEGDLSPRQQRSGSTKGKKKTHRRQHSWDGKVSEDFVPRHLPMRLAKQNHMTMSTTLSRSNKSKKK